MLEVLQYTSNIHSKWSIIWHWDCIWWFYNFENFTRLTIFFRKFHCQNSKISFRKFHVSPFNLVLHVTLFLPFNMQISQVSLKLSLKFVLFSFSFLCSVFSLIWFSWNPRHLITKSKKRRKTVIMIHHSFSFQLSYNPLEYVWFHSFIYWQKYSNVFLVFCHQKISSP